MNQSTPIAIVGMAGIFPGASDLDTFWQNIVQKVDTTVDVPPDRWVVEPDIIYSPKPVPDRPYSKRACLIENFSFNSNGINIEPALLKVLDPLHQIALHAGRNALMDCMSTPDRERTGVVLAAIALPTDTSSALAREITGRAFEESLFRTASTVPSPENEHPLTKEQCLASGVTGLPAAILANGLGLGAGSFTLDAACASSLYAVKLACDTLQLHRADTMLAGGVSRPDCLYTQIGFSQLRALSPSGRCAPFDESADGLVVGEGAGILVLKRLGDALCHGDRIYGVIRGIGLSNDLGGNLLAPDSEGQIRAMKNAYQMAKWSPRDVDLIECHGTGTPVGDRIELHSLRILWGESGWSIGQCPIGSIKSMIGHLLTGAGAAGMIKALLAMNHNILPPSLNFHRAPENSPLHQSPFRVQQNAEEWPAKDRPNRAAVSAFGFGGINGHLLVETWPSDNTKPAGVHPHTLNLQPADADRHPIRIKPQTPETDKGQKDIAIIGMETVLGGLSGLKAFQEAIFNGIPAIEKRPPNRWGGCESIVHRHIGNAAAYGAYISEFSFDYGRFHIPPNEIPDMLPQHLLMLKVAAGAMADAGLPLRGLRADMGVIIGMEFDFNATDFHLRWQMHRQAEQWLNRANPELSLSDIPSEKHPLFNDWLQSLKDASGPPLTHSRTLGALGGIIASRIAREFQFGGPSFTVSGEATAGLKALEIAFRFLKQKELDAVLVGAVDLAGDVRSIAARHLHRSYTEQSSIRPFDQNADGSLPGEGAAAIVIKRLDRAIKDGDRIYAVIKGFGSASGSGFNLDQDKHHYIRAYKRSLNEALEESGISAPSLGLMEAHGSGNPAEDRLELEALNAVFVETPDKRTTPCAIGTTKALTGHAGAVSGLASVIKTSLCLFHSMLSPVAGFRSLSQDIPVRDDRAFSLIHMPIAPSYWARDRKDGARIAGVGAITPAGDVMHSILEEYDKPVSKPALDGVQTERKYPLGHQSAGLFVVESDTQNGLIRGLEDLADSISLHTNGKIPLEMAARRHYQSTGLHPDRSYALSLVAKNRDQLSGIIREAKKAVSANRPAQMTGNGGFSYALNTIGPNRPIAFVYPGSGNHYLGMGRGFGTHWPEILRDLDNESGELMSQMLPDRLVPYRTSWTDEWEQSAQKDLAADPVNMIFGQVLYGTMVTRLMNRFGIHPSAVIGYSLGESAGLFATGAWSDRDRMLQRMRNTDLFSNALAGSCQALRQAWNLPPEMQADWCVAVVNRPESTVRRVIEPLPYVRLLIINTPDQCVIGGQKHQVNSAINRLDCEAVFLEGVVTVHCDAAAPVADAYEALHELPTTPPEGIVYYSCASAASYDLSSRAAAASIRKQAVSGFNFPATIHQAYQDGVRVFLEMGPHCSCTGMIRSILAAKPHLALSASIRGEDEYFTILKSLGTLIAARVPVNLVPLYEEIPLSGRIMESDRQMMIPVIKEPPSPSFAPILEHIGPSIDPAQIHENSIEQANSGIVMPESLKETNTLTHHPFAQMFSLLKENITSTADAHEHFLRFSSDLSKAYADALSFQSRLLLRGKPAVNGADMPWPQSEPSSDIVGGALSSVPALFSREMCLEFATGSIANVLGPDFAGVDTYPYRVRLPDEPLMLVDRILHIEGEKGSLRSGRIVTEHEVVPGIWYLDGGHAPVCISVEAGQADLFLCAYLGIDRVVKGRRVYRLLDATVEFHRELPVPGEVIRYDITIEKFVRQGETYLFFFHFKGTIGNRPLITMTDGCAGFFTPEEIHDSAGIILSRDDTVPCDGKKPDGWPNLVPTGVETYDDQKVDALRKGDLSACFGDAFNGIQLSQSLHLPGGRMKLIDRVIHLDPLGGSYRLGLIRAEADIHPDDWFLTCHFVDDMVMPGTLMYECCAHSFRIFLQRMGWVSGKSAASYEPVMGVKSILKCRGPVTPETRQVHYEVHIKEIGYAPEPYAIADAHMFADARHIVTFHDMAMKMTGVTRHDIESLWISKHNESQTPLFHLPASPPLWNREKLLTFCTGNPSEAFGDRYRPFDSVRFIARLPNQPFLFMDRITRIDPEPWVLAPDGWIESEVELTPDAWYFRANRLPFLPLSALLEIALQPCGWLAAYMGSALKSEKDLQFRNLGGTGTLFENLSPEYRTLMARARLTSVSEAGEIIIEHFDFEVVHKNDKGRQIYAGSTSFGFFSKEAMAQQVGIRQAEERFYKPAEGENAISKSHSFQDIAPLSPEDSRQNTDFSGSTPAKALRMIDRIDTYIPDGGHKKLGFIAGSKDVDPEEWFFKAHFYQDPVCPGSLGIESFIQLVRWIAFDRWKDLIDKCIPALLTHSNHAWTYRGQILPSNKRVEVTAEIADIKERSRPAILANGFLKVDGLCIYEMKNFGLQFEPK